MATPTPDGPRPKSSVFVVRVPPPRHDLPDDEDVLVEWYDRERERCSRLEAELTEKCRENDRLKARLADGDHPAPCVCGSLTFDVSCRACGAAKRWPSAGESPGEP
jgi:hypothetical protein